MTNRIFIFVILSLSYTIISAFDNLVIFGDSLSDTGSLKSRTLTIPSGYNWKNGPHMAYWKGHFSNGPIWPEYFSDFLSQRYENYSMGGASTSSRLHIFSETKYLKLRTYCRDFFTSTINSSIKKYLKNKKSLSPDTVYVLWGGNNNFLSMQNNQRPLITSLGSNYSLNRWDSPEMIKNANAFYHFVDISFRDIESMANMLIKAGAKKIIIPTIFTRPLLPMLLKNKYYYDYLSFIYSTTIYNEKIKTLSKYKEIHIIDMDLELSPIATEPTEYGFTKDLHDSCFKGDYWITRKHTCPKEESQEYFFFDGVHPTSRAQCWISYIFLKNIDASKLIPKNDYLEYCKTSYERLKKKI